MVNYVNLAAVSGDNKIALFWNHVALAEGITTIYSIVTFTRKTVGNTLGRIVLNYQTNPLAGSAELVDLIAGEEYLVSVAQYASNWAVYESDTITVTGPYKSPNAPELRSTDASTIGDLTSISLKTYFSGDYSDGGSALTKMAFTASSDTRIYNFIFDVTNDNIYTLTGLDGDKSYEINVCAINAVGISEESNTITEVTSGYPSAPTDFSINTDYIPVTNETKVNLYWNAPSNADLTDLVGYVIKYKLSTDTVFTEVDISTNLSANMSYEFLDMFTNPGDTYNFKIMTYNSLVIGSRNAHTGLQDAYIFKTSLPVQNVTSIPGDNILEINWNSPSDTRGYNVYDYAITYYTGAVIDNTNLVATVNSFVNSITLTSLSNGQDYCVVIAAQTSNTVKNELIYGEIFTVINVGDSVRTIPFTNPSVPTGVSIIPGNSEISLEWSAPDDDGGFPISHYIISYKVNGTSSYTDVNVGNVTSHTISALTNGVGYDILLYAVNSAISTELSTNEGTQFSQNDVKPYNTSSAVQLLTVVPGNLQVSVSWVEPENTGGFPIDHYKIYLNDSTVYESTVNNTIILSSLTNGSAYTVKVVPYTMPDYLNGEVLMGASATSGVYYPYTSSGPISGLDATPSNEQIVLSWTAPSDTGGFSIDHYEISYIGGLTISTSELSSTIAVNNGADIEFTVKAITINSNNAEELIGASSSVTSRAYTNPLPITVLQVTPEDSKIKLLFIPSANSGGYDIIQYKISRKLHGADDNTYASILINVADLSIVDGNIVVVLESLVNGTSYDVKVEVISDTPAGNNNTSSAVTSANHSPYRPSSGVRNIVVTPYNESLNVEWDAPLDNGGFTVTEYKLYLGGNYHSTTATRSALIPGLTNGTYYLVSIVPVTYPDHISPDPLDGAEVAASASVKPYTIPDPVDSLTATVGDKSIVLDWAAPGDNGGNDIVNYEVVMLESDTELHRETISYSELTFTFDITNVPSITNGTTYTLKCRAITQTDASVLLYSSYQTVTGAPFGKPTEITYTVDDNTDTVTILINNNGSPISGILICAPVSANSTAADLAKILEENTLENPIQNTTNPLVNLFVITMNYDIVSKNSQPMLIVVTNAAGMYYVENFAAINNVEI
jgi:titin